MISTELFEAYKRFEELCKLEGYTLQAGLIKCKNEIIKNSLDDDFRIATYNFVERVLNSPYVEEANKGCTLSVDELIFICFKTICFVREYNEDSIEEILQTINESSIMRRYNSYNVSIAINFLYYSYLERGGWIDNRWDNGTIFHINELIKAIKNELAEQ